MSDPINQPAHYTSGNIECIDAIASALGNEGFAAFLRGQVMKYTWRLGMKDAPAQDAAKAEWYARKLRDVLGEVASASDEATGMTPDPRETMFAATPDPYGPEIEHKPGDPCPYPEEVGRVKYRCGEWERADVHKLCIYRWTNSNGDYDIVTYRLRADHPHYKTAFDPVRVEAERLHDEWHASNATDNAYVLAETAIRRGMEMAQPVPPTEEELQKIVSEIVRATSDAMNIDPFSPWYTHLNFKALDHLRKHVAAIREPKP